MRCFIYRQISENILFWREFQILTCARCNDLSRFTAKFGYFGTFGGNCLRRNVSRTHTHPHAHLDDLGLIRFRAPTPTHMRTLMILAWYDFAHPHPPTCAPWWSWLDTISRTHTHMHIHIHTTAAAHKTASTATHAREPFSVFCRIFFRRWG